MSDPAGAALEWAARTDVPNWMLLVAALTQPAIWSKLVVEGLQKRVSGLLGE